MQAKNHGTMIFESYSSSGKKQRDIRYKENEFLRMDFFKIL